MVYSRPCLWYNVRVDTVKIIMSLLLVACASAPWSKAQKISRDMEACMARESAQEYNSVALECTCEAQRQCLAAGYWKGCAFDEWTMSMKGYYHPVVGRCE